MGLFKRAASALNSVDVPTDFTVALAPSIRRVRKLEERGTPANGVITGIQFSLKSPVSATIVSLTRTTMFGMQTLNFDVELELADGSRSLSKRNDVPSYAQWWAAPGTVVPAVVDPDDTTTANVDWPAFALARRDHVGFDDDPIEGSIAALLEQPAAATPAMTAVPAAVDPSAPVALDMTMRSWVAARKGGQLSEKDFEKALGDWREAGMCTEAHIAAARVAAQT